MFEPYLKSFYIRSTDPTQIKVLKVILYSALLCCYAFLYKKTVTSFNSEAWEYNIRYYQLHLHAIICTNLHTLKPLASDFFVEQRCCYLTVPNYHESEKHITKI